MKPVLDFHRRVAAGVLALCFAVSSVIAPHRAYAQLGPIPIPLVLIVIADTTVVSMTTAQVVGAVGAVAGHIAIAVALWWESNQKASSTSQPTGSVTHINTTSPQQKPPKDPRFDCYGPGGKDYVPCPVYQKSKEANANASGFSTNQDVISAMGGWGAGNTFSLLGAGPPPVLYSYIMTAIPRTSLCPVQVAYPGAPYNIMVGAEDATSCYSLWRKDELLADVQCRPGYSQDPSVPNQCVKTGDPKKGGDSPCETRAQSGQHVSDPYSSNCDQNKHTDAGGGNLPTGTTNGGADKNQESADGKNRTTVHTNPDGSGRIGHVNFDDPNAGNSPYGWVEIRFGPPDATGRNPVTSAQSGASPTPPPGGMPPSPSGKPGGSGGNPGTGTPPGGTGTGTGTGTGAGGATCGGTGQPACNSNVDDSAFSAQTSAVAGAASAAMGAAAATGALDQINGIKNGSLISIATDWVPSFKPGPNFACQELSWNVAVSHGLLAGLSATKSVAFCDKLTTLRDYMSWVIWFGTAIGLVRLFFATVGAYPRHDSGNFKG